MPAETVAAVGLVVVAAVQLLSAQAAPAPRVAQEVMATVQHYAVLLALAAAVVAVRTHLAQAAQAAQAAEESARPLALELRLATDQLSQEAAAAAVPPLAL